MFSGFSGIGSCATTSFIRRTTDREVSFALLVDPEDDASGGTVECLAALLGTCVSGAIRDIKIQGRKPQTTGLIVEGSAEVEFPYAMFPESDSPLSPSDAFKCGGSRHLFANSPFGRSHRNRSYWQ
ncbi:MAG: hypothetical protein A3G00_03740 [Candidatus Magasanikbacteria bacterium RIFCSPLOWO2_12_FULL_43_12]|uniref:Uncharacterized protein n=1 Tax=Candidatus Magasanikbacteria bacterium RIFCSPLOWO2_12_FULL_43_12 TaxID=1798692 RepID=A0A1F6MQP7_9BACT|nr:MAG: hypothetical protein A3G00_03740 [Candidatus Magasanikbacteria bacterium RIFCSPLOWO2_12_FULL_43_12]